MPNITIARVADLKVEGNWDESAIAASVAAFESEEGRLPPITIDTHYRVIQGAPTALAARRLGLNTIAATIVTEAEGRGQKVEGIAAGVDSHLPSPTSETTLTDIPTAALLTSVGQKRTFRIDSIGGSTVVIGGKPYPLVDVELNEVAIASLDDAQLKFVLNAEGDLAFNAADAAVAAASHALTRARKAGLYLLEQRRRVKEGGDGWLGWLKANTVLSDRRAQDWMQIARRWSEIEENAMHRGLDLNSLSMSSALKLLRAKPGEATSIPEEVVTESAVDTPNVEEMASTSSPIPRLPTPEEVVVAFGSSLKNLEIIQVARATKLAAQNLNHRMDEVPDDELLELIQVSLGLANQAKFVMEQRNAIAS